MRLFIILAMVLPQLLSAAELKKRVAVFDFEDKTEHRIRWWTGQPVGEGMADMLVTALVKTGKFQVLERDEIKGVIEEQKLGQSGLVTQESAAQVGKLLGVEIAIFGAVTEFGHSQGNMGGRVKKKGFGLGIKTTEASVGIDIRFINTTTGEILLADNVRKAKSKKGLAVDTPDFRFDNRHKFDESLVGKATREAIETVVEMVEKSAPQVPWQAKVVRGQPIFINAGALSGVNAGDVFIVYRAGEALIDPDTGLNLGSVESKIGTIRVTNNNIGNGKASQCEAVSGTGFERNDIVRLK